MAIESGDLIGGGGTFTPTFISKSIIVLQGNTGTIATVVPPSGERVNMWLLRGIAVMTSLTTVKFGGVTKLASAKLEGNYQNTSIADEFYSQGKVFLFGDIDETLQISTNVATSIDLIYGYAFEVIK